MLKTVRWNNTCEKKHKRPKYSLEFKQDATKLVLEKGCSQQQAADHLGLSLTLDSSRTQAFRPWLGDEKPSLSQGDHNELIRLRKENEQLRMEREILKKAAVFFAKEAEYPQGTSADSALCQGITNGFLAP